MKTGMTWLASITCSLVALPALAADFIEIEVWIYSGWNQISSIVARADGTLKLGTPSNAGKAEGELCSTRATPEEMQTLSRLVREIPANARWGQQWTLPDSCSDEMETTLLVRTHRGVIDLRYSLQCRPVNVPSWVTNLHDAVMAIQRKHGSCPKTVGNDDDSQRYDPPRYQAALRL
jgi:hypothetical protein